MASPFPKVSNKLNRAEPMVTESTRQGLIVSTSPQATAALGELIVCCGWPTLLHATPQRFRRELMLGVPKLSLFWLDDERDVAATVQVLAWLGTNQPAVRRIAVGYRLAADVEVAVRSASAHLYLAVDDNIRALVDGSIFQCLRGRDLCPAEWTAPSLVLNPQVGSPASHRADLHLSEPP